MKDIYFEPKYGKLYENIENGICEVFEFKSAIGTIHHMYIRREIPMRIQGVTYFDLVTPYGYGGPLIVQCKEGSEGELVKEFERKFQQYCDRSNIVSEFVRFHPIVGNAEDFLSVYEVKQLRKTVGTNIKDFEDPVTDEFSKSARKSIRRALKTGVSYQVTEQPDDLSKFKEIYYSTMDRNGASDYYYFDDQYFEKCLESFKENIVLVEVFLGGKAIAAGFYFAYNNTVHAHLSGTLKEYLNFSPAYILKYAVAAWAKEQGFGLVHYGGGTSNEEDDQLYQFKRKFGKHTRFEFYIGQRIWNQTVYNQLCSSAGIYEVLEFFPAYRFEKKTDEEIFYA